jgi:MarR family 2-MHQ and catechol resistance regulon transcriptional repressor
MPTKHRGSQEEVSALNAYIKLQRAAETVFSRTTAHLVEYELTTSQFAILEALYHLGPLSQRELAEKLLKSAGNISIVLKNLEKRGLIARCRDEADHRIRQVSITGVGRATIVRILPDHVAGIVSTFSVLTPDEQQLLADLCKRVGLGAA